MTGFITTESIAVLFVTYNTLTIGRDATVTVTDIFDNFGTINVFGTLKAYGYARLSNAGTIHVHEGATFEGNAGGVTYDKHTFDNGICTSCGFCG